MAEEITASGERSVAVEKMINSIINTGDHNRFFIADYALLDQHLDGLNAQPALSREDVLEAFRASSSALRHARNSVEGIHIARGEVDHIVLWAQTAEAKERLAMLLDQPGAGKTAVMRDVLARLEASDVPVLAIKADHLTGVRTQGDLADRLGLPATVEACVKKAAEGGPVAVLVDQLDALSMTLARDQATLDVMLPTISRLGEINGVRIVASCRTFDLRNDPQLSRIHIDQQFRLEPLSDESVNRVLDALGVDASRLLPGHRGLLQTPLHLDVYARIVRGNPDRAHANYDTLQALYEELWQQVVRGPLPDRLREQDVQGAVYQLVDAMQARQEPAAPVGTLDGLGEAAGWLEHEGFIVRFGRTYQFLHQTLYDYCYARRFVSQGRSLSAEVLSSPQGLFERSQIVQVLAYLRGADLSQYHRELDRLLLSPKLRVHLRLLVIGSLGAERNPTGEELRLARLIMQDGQNLDLFQRSCGGNEGWFDLLKGRDLPALLASGDVRRIDAGARFVATMVGSRRADALTLVRPYRGRDDVWDERIANILFAITDWSDEEGLDILLGQLRQDRATQRAIMCLRSLARTNPDAGCRAVRAFLDRRLEESQEAVRSQAGDVGDQARVASTTWAWAREKDVFSEPLINEVMEFAAKNATEAIIQYLVPWVVQATKILAQPMAGDEQYAPDAIFDSNWYSDRPHRSAEFARNIVGALQAFAKSDPSGFRKLAVELDASESHTVHRMLAQAYLANPQEYGDDIARYLLEDRRRLEIGEPYGDPCYDSLRLFGIAFRHTNAEVRSHLENLVLGYHPKDERQRREYGGHTTMRYLNIVPADLLSDTARRTRQELERRWPGYRLQPPQRATGGQVGSPIPDTAQAKMTDEQWLRAMRKYDDSGREHADFLKGGVEELARSYLEQVKASPERFHALSLQFNETISVHYVIATIEGLAESDAPAELVFDTVRRLHHRLSGESRQPVCWAILKRAKDGVPDDLLDLMTDWATSNPDEDSGSGMVVYSSLGLERAERTVRSYTTRGAATIAVCACGLKREPSQSDRAFHLLEGLMHDPSLAVRTCVFEALAWLITVDAVRALNIFIEAVADHPELLRTGPTYTFMHRCYHDHFEAIRTCVELMMVSEDDSMRLAGGKLATLAGLSHVGAAGLAERSRTGDKELRLGAADVYATNAGHPEFGEACRGYLPALFNDPEKSVREAAAECFRELEPEHLGSARGLIAEFLASQAVLDDAQPFVNYVAKVARDDLALALEATRRLLDVAGDKIMDTSSSWALLEGDLVQLPLIAYNHADVKEQKAEALDLFDRWLLMNSREANRALVDWDRR